MNKTQKIALALAELNAFRAVDGLDAIVKYDAKVNGPELSVYRTAKKAAELAAEAEAEALRIAALTPIVETQSEVEGDEPESKDETETEEVEVEVVDEANREWFTGKAGDRVTKNGVRAPRVDTLCGQAWSHFDRCYKAGTVDTTSIVDAGVAIGLNRGNLRTELSTWRRFHNVARVGVTAPTPVAVVNENEANPNENETVEAPAVETPTVETVTE